MPVGVSAYVALANVTLGSAAATVTFSSIIQTYRDLVLVISAKNTGSNNTIFYQINGDSTSGNYSRLYALGNGSTATSATGPTFNYFADMPISSASNGVCINHFMDYSATDKHKTILGRVDVVDSYTYMDAKRYASTSAITTIQLSTAANNFAAGSSFSLYGIAS